MWQGRLLVQLRWAVPAARPQRLFPRGLTSNAKGSGHPGCSRRKVRGDFWWRAGASQLFLFYSSASWGNVMKKLYFSYFNLCLVHWIFLKCIADFPHLLFCLSCTSLAPRLLFLIFPKIPLSPTYDSWLGSLADIFLFSSYVEESAQWPASFLQAMAKDFLVHMGPPDQSGNRGLGPCEHLSRWMSLPLTRGQMCIYSTCLWVDACFCACVVCRDGYLMTALLLTTLNISSVPVPDARVHVCMEDTLSLCLCTMG